jgi:signal transduction histidine kinase
VAVPPDLPEVALSAGPLTQVLVNLATNARDAMPDGGTFRIAAQIVTGAGRGVGVPGEVRLEITDTGAGMSEDAARRAFEPFYTTRDVEGGLSGTGLGLASVALVIAQAGGRVHVHSEPGAGTTFVVDLPIAP